MSDLKRLFQITLGLAKQVKTHLMTNQIDKAKEETSELIISCERELQVLQKQPISKELSQETYQVLMAARKALRELESHELHSDVKRIINLIVKIEKQEIKEVSEHEKEMTKFYNYWYNNLYKVKLYHATSSLAVPKIKRYGLVPGMVPWDPAELERLKILLNKAGYASFGSYIDVRVEHEKQKHGIYLSFKKYTAEGYAEQGPEIISRFIDHKHLKSKDKKSALKAVYGYIMYGVMAQQMFTHEKVREYLDLYETDRKRFKELVNETTFLSPSEVNEVLSIFNRWWDIFVKSVPTILTISVQSPAILEKYSFCQSFDNFLKYLKAGDESFDEMKDYFKWYFDSSIDIKVTKRIPAEFILKYEKTQKNHIEYDDYAQLHHQSKGWDIGWTSPGTWGPSGAGILVYCPRTDEILLLKRANWVDEPNVWGIPGGACKVTKSGKEKALVAAVSESRDEMGDIPRGKIRVKPYIFHKQGTSFIFETFILEINVFVRKSFVPRLNSENTDHNWFKRIDLIEGKLEIHSGLKELMENYVF